MKPAAFEYHKPQSLDEASAILAQYGDEGKVLAGGQSLVALMNLRLATPTALIDINGLPELDYMSVRDESLRIGALTRHRTIETASLGSEFRLLQDAARYVGHMQVRVRGTFGGAIAHSDPAAEFPLVARTMGAEFLIKG